LEILDEPRPSLRDGEGLIGVTIDFVNFDTNTRVMQISHQRVCHVSNEYILYGNFFSI